MGTQQPVLGAGGGSEPDCQDRGLCEAAGLLRTLESHLGGLPSYQWCPEHAPPAPRRGEHMTLSTQVGSAVQSAPTLSCDHPTPGEASRETHLLHRDGLTADSS